MQFRRLVLRPVYMIASICIKSCRYISVIWRRRQDFKRKNHHKLVLHLSELPFLFHSWQHFKQVPLGYVKCSKRNPEVWLLKSCDQGQGQKYIGIFFVFNSTCTLLLQQLPPKQPCNSKCVMLKCLIRSACSHGVCGRRSSSLNIIVSGHIFIIQQAEGCKYGWSIMVSWKKLVCAWFLHGFWS